jgi:hypothetical protein
MGLRPCLWTGGLKILMIVFFSAIGYIVKYY